MKKLLSIFLFLCTIGTYAKEIPVVANGNIPAAINSASVGDVIKLAAGVWTNPAPFDLKPGVSIKGSGKDVTILKFNAFNPNWIGCIKLHSDRTTEGNQSISDLTLDGQGGSAWGGLQIRNRTNIKIYNVNITGFFDNGIEVIGTSGNVSSDIEIYNFYIWDSSRETTAGSQGNIKLNGFLKKIFVHDGKIRHVSNTKIGPWADRQSGYAIKAAVVWDGSTNMGGQIEDSEFKKITEEAKATAPWSNYTAPNISFEFWGTKAIRVKIDSCTLVSHLSLEYPFVTGGVTSFEVFGNKFKVPNGQSVEFAVPYSKLYNNTFDYTENSNAWNIIGNYNKTSLAMEGQQIYNNKFILGNRAPAIIVSYNKLVNFKFYSNTIEGNSKPVLLNLRTTNSANSNNISFTENSYGSGYTELSFTEGANGIRPTNFIVTAGKPVTEPPVVVNPPKPVDPVVSPKPTDPVTPTNPVTGSVFTVNSPKGESTHNFASSKTLPIAVIPGDVKAATLLLKIIRFDTRAEVWSETIKITDPKVQINREVEYEKLKATNRYLLEVKTTEANGWGLVKQVYVTFNTIGTPTVTPPVVVVPKPVYVNIKVDLTIIQGETLGIPVIVKDSINKKYILTIPYNK